MERRVLRRALWAVFALFFLVFSLSVSPLHAMAATFQDDMTRLDGGDTRSYSNLRSLSLSADRGKLSPGAATFASTSHTVASVTYRVQGARQITAGFFSQMGSFVSAAGDGGRYLGISGINVGASDTGVRPVYSPSTGLLYTTVSGGWASLCAERESFAFTRPVTGGPPADALPYGLSFYYSTDGASYRALSTQLRTSHTSGNYDWCYEEFIAAVPTGAMYLKVEIVDFSTLDTYDSGNYGTQARYSTQFGSLGKVTIEGESLLLGIPEPVQEESTITTPPSSSAEEEEESSSAKASRTAVPKESETVSKSGEVPSKQESSAASSSSSKFEGSAGGGSTGGSKSGGTTSPKVERSAGAASQASASSGSKAESSQEELEEDESFPEQLLFQVEAPEKDRDPFSAGVAVYIAVVAGVILFVALRPKKGK
ncbi:MAG: hypothetical protein ACK5LX_01375 [Oscillospiraceae bacterium]